MSLVLKAEYPITGSNSDNTKFYETELTDWARRSPMSF